MKKSVLRQVFFYIAVALVVLGYVALLSGAFGPTGKPLDDRGAAPTEQVTLDTSRLIARIVTALAVVCVWVILDILELKLFHQLDSFTRSLIRVLTGWASFLALGTFIAEGNHRVLAGVIVLGVTASFLSLWILVLRLKQRRVQQEAL